MTTDPTAQYTHTYAQTHMHTHTHARITRAHAHSRTHLFAGVETVGYRRIQHPIGVFVRVTEQEVAALPTGCRGR